MDKLHKINELTEELSGALGLEHYSKAIVIKQKIEKIISFYDEKLKTKDAYLHNKLGLLEKQNEESLKRIFLVKDFIMNHHIDSGDDAELLEMLGFDEDGNEETKPASS